MRGLARSLRGAAVIVLAALAAPVSAYVRSSDKGTGKDLFWPLPLVPYRVSDTQLSAQSPTCAASASGDPALEAVRAAFSTWREACADIDLLFAGQIADVRTGTSGTRENLVVFRNGWCSAIPAAAACMASGAEGCGNAYDCFEDHTPQDRSIVALTSALYDPDTGRIVNADIEVNGWDGLGAGTSLSGTSGPAHGWYFTCDEQSGWPQCTSYGQTGCYYIDLQNTVTHEVGHFIGLAHPCGDPGLPTCASDPAYAETTMYPQTTPGDLAKRTLAPDDIAGLCAIYPASGGGCGCGSGGAPGALGALLAVLACWPRRRSRGARG